MDIYQFPALVVTDEQLHVLGVLTEGDLSRAVNQHEGVLKLSDLPVAEFMSKEPRFASPDAEISDALRTMLDSGLTILPVVEEERLLGIVLRVDLMQAMLLDVNLAEPKP